MPTRSRSRRFVPEAPIHTFRVRIRDGFYLRQDPSGVLREIEIAANQTMADLGWAIPLAFGFEDQHLWSFFLSGEAWDRASEYTVFSQSGGFVELDSFLEPSPAQRADESLIRDVPYPGGNAGTEFLYLFDYGDQWEFGVTLIGMSGELTPGARYPRVSRSVGEAPPQYPDEEDAFEWEEGGEGVDADATDEA